MKSKIKRHSRSVMAVILTISMLISTMMVGLIATDAARVADDDEVSWNSSTDRLHIRTESFLWKLFQMLRTFIIVMRTHIK